MRAIKFLILLLVLTVLVSCAQMSSSVIAPAGIADNDHEALVNYYENLAKEAKIRLQANKKILEAYEARPYYYGKQGLDLPSHTSANIRAYEKTVRESLRYADLHRRMAQEQKNSQFKAEASLNSDFTMEKPEHSGNKGL